MRLLPLALLGASSLLELLQGGAPTSVAIRVSASAGDTVQIDVGAGQLELRAGEDGEVRVEGSADGRVRADRSGNVVAIWGAPDAALVVYVPRSLRVAVRLR